MHYIQQCTSNCARVMCLSVCPTYNTWVQWEIEGELICPNGTTPIPGAQTCVPSLHICFTNNHPISPCCAQCVTRRCGCLYPPLGEDFNSKFPSFFRLPQVCQVGHTIDRCTVCSMLSKAAFMFAQQLCSSLPVSKVLQNDSKTQHVLTKPQHTQAAKEIFKDTGITVSTEGECYGTHYLSNICTHLQSLPHFNQDVSFFLLLC